MATLKEHRARAERGEHSELMDLLIIYKWADAFAPFNVLAPVDPIEQGVEAGKESRPIDLSVEAAKGHLS